MLLVANTASFCGYTYQYDGLEKLHQAAAPRGLTVIGVPSRDFNQESADNTTVKTFCETKFGVEFPMTGISHVRGPRRRHSTPGCASRRAGSRTGTSTRC